MSTCTKELLKLSESALRRRLISVVLLDTSSTRIRTPDLHLLVRNTIDCCAIRERSFQLVRTCQRLLETLLTVAQCVRSFQLVRTCQRVLIHSAMEGEDTNELSTPSKRPDRILQASELMLILFSHWHVKRVQISSRAKQLRLSQRRGLDFPTSNQ